MKRFSLLALLVLVSFYSSSQELSVGYFSHYGFQPGGKVGLTVETPYKGLLFSPQFAYFSRLGNNTNWLINLELGKKHEIEGKRRYLLFSGGVGYWRQSEELGFSIDLGSGSTTSREYELKHYVVPTLNLEMGWAYEKLGYFVKSSVGSRIGDGESSMVIFLELGLKLKLKGDE